MLDGLAGVVLDVNLVRETLAGLEEQTAARAAQEQDGLAGANESEITRLANIHARLKTHNEAVEKSKATAGEEPEFKEYLARWVAFVTEMNKLGEKAQSVLPWIGSDSDIQKAEFNQKMLIDELEVVNDRIKLRKQTKLAEILASGVKRMQESEKAGTNVPPPGRTKEEQAKLDADFKKTLDKASEEAGKNVVEKSPATTAPPGPPPKKEKMAKRAPARLRGWGLAPVRCSR